MKFAKWLGFGPDYKKSDPDIREAAVKRLTDPNIIAEVAKNDVNRNVRIAAITNPYLIDQTFFIQLALDVSVDDRERTTAIERLTDEPTLYRLSYSDPCLYKVAVQNPNLSDAVLADIAEKECFASRPAVERIRDIEILTKLATSCTNKIARREAVKRLDDPTILKRIAYSDEDRFVREIAMDRLPPHEREAVKAWVDPAVTANITDGNLLCNIALTAGSPETREAAVRNQTLTDQSLFADIAKMDQWTGMVNWGQVFNLDIS